jgi:catechol 2,3-dioxygenase-like lactoylglutathione lyase family enzyme
MIDHTGFNVTDIAASREFYRKVLAPLGYGICMELADAVGFGAQQSENDDPAGDFWLSLGQPQVPRTHVAFRAQSPDQVDAFFHAAIAAGGKDNGPPGLRPRYHGKYYAAFILDPDGYNVEAVCHTGDR